jgi:hypothetical protein
MLNVISFLEQLGANARIRYAGKAELELVLDDTMIEPVLRAAILSEDLNQIETSLQCKSIICCGVFPGKEKDDESEEEPAKDDEEVQARDAGRRAA